MIIVTGTKRSGTSMWMQILIAAGFPHIGEAFPMRWEQTIKAANPDGFFESHLRRGVFYKTNPHPKTGAYLFPEQVQHHADDDEEGVFGAVPAIVKSLEPRRRGGAKRGFGSAREAVDRPRAGQLEAREQAERGVGDRQPRGAADRREHHALDEQLPRDPRAARADRQPHRDLAAP